jgi:UDP-N-acetylmuramate--alanine ligase
LVVVFQPHLYSRTRDFFQGFAAALSQADVALLMDIYPAREAPMAGVDSELILREMAANRGQLVKRATLEDELNRVIEPPAVLLTLGAGDIDREVGRLKTWAEAFVAAHA